ncbi:glycoside hydrolase family 3 C-terminal domain-containing protein [Blautia sp. HCP3S3_H10_1]|uniref:glycoside hydrolase family 3 C-terminal domain-containing protein n=1 Tax=unclassified Blautia TaxID=2648079 RepID=UPI003F9151CC|nr:glycoside hydrolase family 3 C-terminal domain-containing protein [Clostridia bacterium]
MNREEARKKATKLVNQMTLEEKASQLRYDAPAIKRLGIPAYNWWNEGLHGVARAGQATVFPQAIGLGATFDTALLGEIADVTATEGRAKYNAYSQEEDRDIYKGLTFWSPNVNIFRDPRWGRGHETYGEDPYLTKELGVAFVKGIQGDGEIMKAAACAKHFAVHSGPEAIRHEFDAVVSQKDMEETYLPAFEALTKEADVEGFMGAYNRTNGEPCCGSPTLQKKLRGDWGFQGYFVSDCWAIKDFHEHHMVTSTPAESAALALNNGCDLNCGNTYLHILKAYEKGLISEETITESAIRLFTTRYMLGLFEETEYDKIPYSEVESPAHLALSRKAAEESFVLLKNNGILPLQKEMIKTIGIVGPNADSRAALVGNYHGTASRYCTIQEGIQDYLSAAGSDVRVLASVGCDLFRDRTEHLALTQDRLAEAKIVAANSDVVILCVGLDETLEGEEGDTGNSYASGDKETLKLPQVQLDLMEAMAASGKPIVLCLMAGSDIDLSYAAEHFDAVMVLWYPGTEGGKAAARVLFGDVSPSGKLPVTFYETLEELPDFTDYAMKGRTYRYMENKAQFPFGYGLTYGKVVVTDAVAQKSASEAIADSQSAKVTITATVTNQGQIATREVVQVYLKNTDSPLAVRNPELVAFTSVFLDAGETKVVTLSIAPRAFTVVDENGVRREDGSHFRIYVGCSQPDERSVELTGVKPVEIEYMK